MSRLDGGVGIRGTQTPVDASFSGIMDNFDIGYLGHIEAEKEPWLFLVDLLYLKLKDDELGPILGSTEITMEQTILEFMGGYEIYRGFISSNPD